MSQSLGKLIIHTLHYPTEVFDQIKLTEKEIRFSKEKLRLIFNDKELNPDINHPDYGQLLKLISLSYRAETTKKWMNYLINEFKKVQDIYKASHNLIFSTLVTMIAYMDGNMESILSQILFKPEKWDTNDQGVFSYKNLTSKQQNDVKYYQHYLKEIKSLSDITKSRMKELKSVYDTKSLHKFGFIQIIDIYNLLEKIQYVIKELYGIKIINRYLDEFRFIRNSIAHSHFIYTEMHKNNVIYGEFYNVDIEKRKATPFERRPLDIAVEMLLIASLLCQILVLYQLTVQTKQIRIGEKEIKPGFFVSEK